MCRSPNCSSVILWSSEYWPRLRCICLPLLLFRICGLCFWPQHSWQQARGSLLCCCLFHPQTSYEFFLIYFVGFNFFLNFKYSRETWVQRVRYQPNHCIHYAPPPRVARSLYIHSLLQEEGHMFLFMLLQCLEKRQIIVEKLQWIMTPTAATAVTWGATTYLNIAIF